MHSPPAGTNIQLTLYHKFGEYSIKIGVNSCKCGEFTCGFVDGVLQWIMYRYAKKPADIKVLRNGSRGMHYGSKLQKALETAH